jgi:hypothetical protein
MKAAMAGVGGDDAPTDLLHWGRTIVAGLETLKTDFEKLSSSMR